MARDPEKRAYSRKVDATRKKARRAVQRLEQQLGRTQNFIERRAIREKINELHANLIQLSARGKGRTYTEKARAALESLSSPSAKVATTRELKQSIGKTDELFAQAFRAAKAGRPTILGWKGREKTQIFYRVTQPLWEGYPLRERNQRIVEGLGVENLQQAYAYVMKQPDVREVLKMLDTSGGEIDDTDTMGYGYYEAERTQHRIDTPTEVMFVQMLESVKAYGATA